VLLPILAEVPTERDLSRRVPVPTTSRVKPDAHSSSPTNDGRVDEGPPRERRRTPLASAALAVLRITRSVVAVPTGPDRSGALLPLTGLRWIAAVYIVVLHTGIGAAALALDSSQPSTHLGAVARAVLALLGHVGTFGYVATGFFLVLGGYALAIGYLDRTTGTFRRDRRAFWRSRFVRFVPLLLLTQGLRIPQYLLRQREAPWSEVATSLGVHVTGLQAWFPAHVMDLNYPAWTMTLLFSTWAVFPWVGPRLARLSARELVLALVACQAYALATACLLPTLDTPEPGAMAFWRTVLSTHPLVRGVDILSGILLACLHRRRGATARRLAPALLVASFASLLGACAVSGTVLPPDLARNGLLLAPILALLVALVEYAGGRHVAPRGRLLGQVDRLGAAVVAGLTRPRLLRAAEASFTLYLVHAVPMSALTIARDVVAGRPVVFGGEALPAHPLELPLILAYLVGITLLALRLHRHVTVPLQQWAGAQLAALEARLGLERAPEPATARDGRAQPTEHPGDGTEQRVA